MKKTTYISFASVVFFIALVAVFILGNMEILSDPVAVPSALILAILLIGSTTALGIVAYRDSSRRGLEE